MTAVSRAVLASAVLLALAGCSKQVVQQAPPQPRASDIVAPPSPPSPPAAAYSAQTLQRVAVSGSRMATPEDVTHVRWRVAPATAAQGQGRIAYSAIVR